MIIRTTTHTTRITTEPGSTYDDAPRESTFRIDGRERPMLLDGRIEDSIHDRLLQPNIRDVRELAPAFTHPEVDKARELLEQGAKTVEVDLGALGRWTAERAEDKTRFWQGDSETNFSLGGRYVILETSLAPEMVMQSIVGRFNESSGTITALSETIRTTERAS